MANIEFSTKNIRRVPIKRNNLFYSEESFNFETEIGKNYIETDVNQTIVLFSVDLSKTNTSAIYGETRKDEIVFFPPVELHVIYEIQDSELKTYDKTKSDSEQSDDIYYGRYMSKLYYLGEVGTEDVVSSLKFDRILDYVDTELVFERTEDNETAKDKLL